MIFRKLLILFIGSAMLFACQTNDYEASENHNFSEGVIIINEGNFMHSNGDLSHYRPETDVLTNNIFSSQNSGVPAGDVIQSFAATDSLGLFVANNSKSLTAVRLKDFTFKARLEGLKYPRYIRTDNNETAYLTDGKFPSRLLKINIPKMQVTDSITLGAQAENLLITKEHIICCNGAWGADSTISIIRKSDFSLQETRIIGKGTTDITQDQAGNIWILCQGETLYDENWEIVNESRAELVCLNPAFEEIYRTEVDETGNGFQPVRLASTHTADFVIAAGKQGIYKFDSMPKTSTLIISGNYYGLAVEPYTNYIYVFSDEGFQGNGYFKIYDARGQLIKEKTYVGIGPNGACFLPGYK